MSRESSADRSEPRRLISLPELAAFIEEVPEITEKFRETLVYLIFPADPEAGPEQYYAKPHTTPQQVVRDINRYIEAGKNLEKTSQDPERSTKAVELIWQAHKFLDRFLARYPIAPSPSEN